MREEARKKMQGVFDQKKGTGMKYSVFCFAANRGVYKLELLFNAGVDCNTVFCVMGYFFLMNELSV